MLPPCHSRERTICRSSSSTSIARATCCASSRARPSAPWSERGSPMASETLLKEAEDHMNKSMEATKREMATVRTGKATTSLLDNIRIDYYGSHVPLRQVANVAAPE